MYIACVQYIRSELLSRCLSIANACDTSRWYGVEAFYYYY
jgi:hypothetical protein